MNGHYVEKEFYDYADNIEGVNIHYVWTPFGGTVDWENQRMTRFMPLVRSSLAESPISLPLTDGGTHLSSPRLRKKILKLPQQIPDSASGTFTNRYLLHHYFEIFQDGHRHYSPLYTEEIATEVKVQLPEDQSKEKRSSLPFPVAYTVKESE